MAPRDLLRPRASAHLAGWLMPLAAILSLDVTAPTAIQGAQGSAPAGPVVGQNAAFTHITLEHGLSDQRVQAITQDRAGFMWFGTNNGLNRYDGYRVVAYRNDPTDPHSLSGDIVNALYEDRSGTLWVGTSSGLNAFDRRTEQFARYQHDPANPHTLSNNGVGAIYEDRSGALWVGTTGGLNVFDRDTGTFAVYHHDTTNPRSLSHDTVRAIAEDRSGILWIGTLSGLNRFDRASDDFSVYHPDPADPRSLSNDRVWDILEDRAGTLWVGTDGGGLSRFDPASGIFTHYRHDPSNPHSLGDDRVDCLFEDASGALWIGTFGGGVSVLDAARQTFRTYRHDSTFRGSLSYDYIADIVADRSGLVWIGTHGSGVDLHDPRRQTFTIYRYDSHGGASLASDNVWAISEDRGGILWIGTQDRGLDRFDRRSGQITHYPPDPMNPRRLGHAWVSALEHDSKGALWVGTYGGGLYRLDKSSGRFTAYRHDPANPRSLGHDGIVDLHLDRSGTLWVATHGGLHRFEPASGTFTAYRHDPANPDSLTHDSLSSIAEDPAGRLWIGTYGSGLNCLDPATGKITRYRHDPQDPTSLGVDSIWTLHMDRSGVLWVGTVGGGLDRFDRARGVFTHYRERNGLASNRIVSIVEDGDAGDLAQGNLWIATSRGLSKLDRDRKTFHNYGTSHGLPLTEYNQGSYRTSGGDLLISSIDGLIAFDPDALQDNTDVLPVVFTNFLVANKPVPIGERSPLHQVIDQTGSITLTYADRVISFEFAALNYRAPGDSRYRYRLEGFDDDWIEVGGTQRLVTYTNLAPRKYVFRVAAAKADGTWSEAGRAIALVVKPPWWATWWFRALALAFIAGCATSVYAWRVSSLQRRRRALEAEIAERKVVEEALRESNRRIQDLAGRLITSQEVERTRIARDLHDDVCQEVAAVSVDLSHLRQQGGQVKTQEVQEILLSVQRRTEGVAESLRLLSHGLHPSILQHIGLQAALESHCAEIERQHHMQVKCFTDGEIEPSSHLVALSLFRIAQEALRNSARHGHARHATVALSRAGTDLTLTIADDGVGFDREAIRQTGDGLGLVSIEERARLVKGQATIHSQPGRGTVVVVRVTIDGMAEPREPEPDNSSMASVLRAGQSLTTE